MSKHELEDEIAKKEADLKKHTENPMGSLHVVQNREDELKLLREELKTRPTG